MNSLNLLSSRVIGPPSSETPFGKRSRSYSDGNLEKFEAPSKPKRSASQHVKGVQTRAVEEEAKTFSRDIVIEGQDVKVEPENADEKTPLLEKVADNDSLTKSGLLFSKIHQAAKKLVAALTQSLRWVLSTLASPGVYVVGSFYDEDGKYSSLLPIRKISRIVLKRNGRRSTAQAVGLSSSPDSHKPSTTSSMEIRNKKRKAQPKDARRKPQGVDSFAPSSESEAEIMSKTTSLATPLDSRPKLQTSSSSEDYPQTRRAIRIKHNREDTSRRRKQNKEKSSPISNIQKPLTAANLKSPTSPTSSLKLTKYPDAPAPPRPLIPARQPSYSSSTSSRFSQKTLVIDLDETLIHSLAKGGRMSSGHMVEVKLNTTVGEGGATLGPQHPILYYVHKRPHCDEFLRKVYKWYNLIVFTASVQQYADPVIDWLEQERQYFSARYYRDQCTARHGAFIKDLSSVEPDLSKVMILDNSPLSYIFHEDNAIPIEGWINDPTDNELLHLVPILEALQYVTDVRAFLALRRGEMPAMS
ncbi:Nuclear envelope morphology protein 1 [Lecanora helva]